MYTMPEQLTTEKDDIELIPFWALALATAKHIRQDLEREYQKNPSTYYNAARKSKFYNNAFSQRFSLSTEDAYRKALGMIEFCITKYDDDTLEEQFLLADASVTMLFQKGYRKLYNMCRNIPRNNIIDFDELVVQALNKNSKYVSSEDQVTGTIAAAYFFVNYLVEEDQIENQESMDELILARQEYVQTLSDDNLFYQSDQKDEIEHYIKELPKCENFLFSFLQNPDTYHPYLPFFEMENLSWNSICEEMQFTQQDVKKIAISYALSRACKDMPSQDLKSYAADVFFLLVICKAYRQAKDYYFTHNQEQIQLQVDYLQKTVKQLHTTLANERTLHKAEIDRKNQQIANLSTEIEKLTRRNQYLQEKLQKSEEVEHNGIHMPPDHSLKNESKPYAEEADLEELDVTQMKELKKVHGVIVGGHPIWVKKVRAQLPNWQFITDEESGVNRSLSIRKADVVFFVTAHLSHTLFDNMIAQAQLLKIPIEYLSRTNIKLSFYDMYMFVASLDILPRS